LFYALIHNFFVKNGGWRHRLVGYIGTVLLTALFFSGVSIQLDALIDAKENLVGNVDEHGLSRTLPSNLSRASKDVCIMSTHTHISILFQDMEEEKTIDSGSRRILT